MHKRKEIFSLNEIPTQKLIPKFGRFSASTLSSTLALAHPLLAFLSSPTTKSVAESTGFSFLIKKVLFVFFQKSSFFAHVRRCFNPHFSLPRASCHLQSSGTTCLRLYEIQRCWIMWLCASKLVGRFVQLDKRQILQWTAGKKNWCWL